MGVPQVRPDGGSHPLHILQTDPTLPVRNIQLCRGELGFVGVEGGGVDIVKVVTKVSNGKLTRTQQTLMDLGLIPR